MYDDNCEFNFLLHSWWQEGLEYNVLETIDFSKVDIKVLMVELWNSTCRLSPSSSGGDDCVMIDTCRMVVNDPSHPYHYKLTSQAH